MSARQTIASLAARAYGRAVFGSRVEYTIWNVTPGIWARPVGAYTGWLDVPGSREDARRTAFLRAADLRAEWPSDTFEIREEYR